MKTPTRSDSDLIDIVKHALGKVPGVVRSEPSIKGGASLILGQKNVGGFWRYPPDFGFCSDPLIADFTRPTKGGATKSVAIYVGLGKADVAWHIHPAKHVVKVTLGIDSNGALVTDDTSTVELLTKDVSTVVATAALNTTGALVGVLPGGSLFGLVGVAVDLLSLAVDPATDAHSPAMAALFADMAIVALAAAYQYDTVHEVKAYLDTYDATTQRYQAEVAKKFPSTSNKDPKGVAHFSTPPVVAIPKATNKDTNTLGGYVTFVRVKDNNDQAVATYAFDIDTGHIVEIGISSVLKGGMYWLDSQHKDVTGGDVDEFTAALNHQYINATHSNDEGDFANAIGTVIGTLQTHLKQVSQSHT